MSPTKFVRLTEETQETLTIRSDDSVLVASYTDVLDLGFTLTVGDEVINLDATGASQLAAALQRFGYAVAKASQDGDSEPDIW